MSRPPQRRARSVPGASGATAAAAARDNTSKMWDRGREREKERERMGEHAPRRNVRYPISRVTRETEDGWGERSRSPRSP